MIRLRKRINSGHEYFRHLATAGHDLANDAMVGIGDPDHPVATVTAGWLEDCERKSQYNRFHSRRAHVASPVSAASPIIENTVVNITMSRCSLKPRSLKR